MVMAVDQQFFYVGKYYIEHHLPKCFTNEQVYPNTVRLSIANNNLLFRVTHF